ncbi:MAG: hypothetical protein IRY83_04005 [Chloroflexi bacterium]|nr:hypothetical protein [Chloroflexota bacterium]
MTESLPSYIRAQHGLGAHIYVHALDGGTYLISDGMIARQLPCNHPILGDQALFPRLPLPGRCLVYRTESEPREAGSRLIEIWNDQSRSISLTRTPVLYEVAEDCLCRIFVGGGVYRVLVQERFLSILTEGKPDSIRYSLRGSIVYLAHDDQTIGLVMPLDGSVWAKARQVFVDLSGGQTAAREEAGLAS